MGVGKAQNIQDLCVQTDAPAIASALTALHMADFDDLQPAQIRDRQVDKARENLIVSPTTATDLLDNFKDQPSVRIATCELDTNGPVFSKIVSMGHQVKLVLPAGYELSQAKQHALETNKVVVRFSSMKFNGSMITSAGKTFVGSQCMTSRHFGSMRQVGLLFNSAEFKSGVQLGGAE
jgi:hypothetical protein